MGGATIFGTLVSAAADHRLPKIPGADTELTPVGLMRHIVERRR